MTTTYSPTSTAALAQLEQQAIHAKHETISDYFAQDNNRVSQLSVQSG